MYIYRERDKIDRYIHVHADLTSALRSLSAPRSRRSGPAGGRERRHESIHVYLSINKYIYIYIYTDR